MRQGSIASKAAHPSPPPLGRLDGAQTHSGLSFVRASTHDSEETMQFSIYSEIQSWPGKTQQQIYAEALEQVVNADRLGYSTYAIIEHFFFPKFGASPNPFAFFAKASERARNIKFRTLLHVLPYHNTAVLASQIAQFDMLVDGRYEFGLGRGH